MVYRVALPYSPSFAVKLLIFSLYHHHRILHSFPTRRSSDLKTVCTRSLTTLHVHARFRAFFCARRPCAHARTYIPADRKSTRLNSSHPSTSYAVFCLKKNTPKRPRTTWLSPPSFSTRTWIIL